jgi:hypothetical protein
MIATFVFCSDFAPYANNRIRSPDVKQRYPGAGWVAEFATKAESNGYSFTTGDIALRQVRNGDLKPSNIFIISEQDSADAAELCRLGSTPLAIFCFESPLFAAEFYSNIPLFASDYKMCIFFNGVFKDVFPDGQQRLPVRFPAFDPRDIDPNSTAWEARRKLVMIAGNKYWRTPFSWTFLFNAKRLESWLRGKLSLTSSPIKRLSRLAQLHDTRLALIEFFGLRGLLDLYGAGWNDPSKLPHRWKQRLGSLLSHLQPVPCQDKVRTMANYRFALCLENISYPGYITEKLIDCLVAGAVPIYLGAPDVSDFIPADCFIDCRRFQSFQALEDELQRVEDDKGASYLKAGRDFLQSDAGREFTYHGFAETLLSRTRPFISA